MTEIKELDLNASTISNRASEELNKNGAVISDARTIHRGSIEKGKDINRHSFWFQIDANTDEAERLLLNPEYLPSNIFKFLKVSILDRGEHTKDNKGNPGIARGDVYSIEEKIEGLHYKAAGITLPLIVTNEKDEELI